MPPVVYIRATWRTFRPQPSKSVPKKAWSEKITYIFRKRNLLIFREKNIQKPGVFWTRSIFRNRGIYRTLSKHLPWNVLQRIYLAHFSAQARKLKKWKSSYIFGKWNFLTLILIFFFYFRKQKPPKNFMFSQIKVSLIFLEMETTRKKIIFQEAELSVLEKWKKTYSWKVSYISGKWNFLIGSLKNFLHFKKELSRPEN